MTMFHTKIRQVTVHGSFTENDTSEIITEADILQTGAAGTLPFPAVLYGFRQTGYDDRCYEH
jgi:hypothetical protein